MMGELVEVTVDLPFLEIRQQPGLAQWPWPVSSCLYTLHSGGASTTNFEVANVTVDSELEVSLPPTFWNTVNVSWTQLEKRFDPARSCLMSTCR